MPKVMHVKAGKDYPEFGIAKGEMHYTWNLMLGPRSSRTYRQKLPPKRSQLTTSSFLSAVYDIEDSIAALQSLDDIEDIVQSLRDLAEEEEEKYDNMPEGLQQGSTGQMIESRKDGCESAADELEQIETEFDEEEPEDDSEKGEWQERKDEWLAERLEEARNVSISYE
jgi:hypothetical protein